ncbi:hypothetical protein [Segniliparus rugosus]|uniref:Secreted protein n=1 Tax=Segniliparus rugosus (strain ATCC BAA-974 / DSM 45345 / CCUG 50838 / CIP 108380 / JCM 13579 / CDC 945) TaxID=679197 RepID=E5XL17_SEGRC|nr:hypothetical protein [Segniliparus rugosus]EFV14999.1 hypothetical protein HMPREF9336_00186 [Segniliparus rugosus ATCC BAA-974]
MRIRGALILALLLGLADMPQAVAVPQFPDLDGYAAADVKDYETYHTYGVNGVQFVTQDGVRCRMPTYSRGPAYWAKCWGPLPGVSHGENAVIAPDTSTGSDGQRSFGTALKKTDLAGFETANQLEGPGHFVQRPIDPDSYHLLAPGRKLEVGSAEFGATCAVGEAGMVACVAHWSGDYGFVLSREGSWTF